MKKSEMGEKLHYTIFCVAVVVFALHAVGYLAPAWFVQETISYIGLKGLHVDGRYFEPPMMKSLLNNRGRRAADSSSPMIRWPSGVMAPPPAGESIESSDDTPHNLPNSRETQGTGGEDEAERRTEQEKGSDEDGNNNQVKEPEEIPEEQPDRPPTGGIVPPNMPHPPSDRGGAANEHTGEKGERAETVSDVRPSEKGDTSATGTGVAAPPLPPTDAIDNTTDGSGGPLRGGDTAGSAGAGVLPPDTDPRDDGIISDPDGPMPDKDGDMPNPDEWTPGPDDWMPNPDDWAPGPDDWMPNPDDWAPGPDDWMPNPEDWTPGSDYWTHDPDNWILDTDDGMPDHHDPMNDPDDQMRDHTGNTDGGPSWNGPSDWRQEMDNNAGTPTIVHISAGLWCGRICINSVQPTDGGNHEADGQEWCTMYARTNGSTLDRFRSMAEYRAEATVALVLSFVSLVAASMSCCTQRHLVARLVIVFCSMFVSSTLMAIPVVHTLVRHEKRHKSGEHQVTSENHSITTLETHDAFDHWSAIVCAVGSIVGVVSAIVLAICSYSAKREVNGKYKLEQAGAMESGGDLKSHLSSNWNIQSLGTPVIMVVTDDSLKEEKDDYTIISDTVAASLPDTASQSESVRDGGDSLNNFE